MTTQSKEIVICDSCGKTDPKTEIRYLRLKTCCSFRQVPVCKDCWNKLNSKK